MNRRRPIRAYGGKEVLGFQTVYDFLQLLAVTSEENGACSWTIPDADNISLYKSWTIWCRAERLIISPSTIGLVRDRVFVKTWTC